MYVRLYVCAGSGARYVCMYVYIHIHIHIHIYIQGECVPCGSTEPGFYRIECGPMTPKGGGFPLEEGHPVPCEQCEAQVRQ